MIATIISLSILGNMDSNYPIKGAEETKDFYLTLHNDGALNLWCKQTGKHIINLNKLIKDNPLSWLCTLFIHQIKVEDNKLMCVIKKKSNKWLKNINNSKYSTEGIQAQRIQIFDFDSKSEE